MEDIIYGDIKTINIENISWNNDNYRTEMKIGNITIYNTKSFTRFQKKMLKWCFGFDEINDIK